MGVVIVTPAEIAAKTVNQGLLDLYKTEEGQAELVKYESIVADKIRIVIDPEIFKDGENYVIPEDLKIITVSLIESFYTYCVVDKQNNATKKVTSRKIDDYSETFSEATSEYKFFGIPADKDIEAVLNKYAGKDAKGFRDINVR